MFADVPRCLRRVTRDLRREGPVRRAAAYARRRWRRVTDRRVLVLEWRHADAAVGAGGDTADGLWVGRYSNPADLPPSFYRAVEAEEGPAGVDRVLDRFLSAAVLWVPWLSGRPAGYLWTRRGDAAGPRPAETRLVAMATFRSFRGGHVASRAAAEACRGEASAGGRVVAAIAARDAAAVRALESAGFLRTGSEV